jgi:AraC-like DNA-binding protein
LFICSAREENPSELALALFKTQILIRQFQYGEVGDVISRTRLVFFYAAETPPNLGEVLAPYLERVNAPVLVARKNSLGLAAQQVKEVLAGGETGERAAAMEWGQAVSTEQVGVPRIGRAQETLPNEEALWQGVLPDISLVDGDGAAITAATDLQDYRAEYACRYVLAHFQENINRDKMAEMVNLSPGYFSNLFRAEVGMSFSDYLIQVRIENAKRLLRRFDLSVEAISKQCGFNSLAHFSRTFKDRCGLSPLKYRKSPNSVA